jgi:putative MATE family efflux protein
MSHAAFERSVLGGPILRTFFYYAVPSLIGLVAISTASIVDGMFVSRNVGADALAAVNLLLPYFTLLFGLSLMLSMGGSIRAGHHLGAGDVGAASATFSKSVVAVVLLSSAAALLGNLYDHALYRLLGAPESLFPLMRDYFRVISVALIVQLGTLVVYYFVRLDGRPLLATSAVVTGALGNIALNALFVASWGWGVRGAACATGLAQLLQLAVLLSHFVTGKAGLRFNPLQRGWGELGRSALNGASEFVNEISVGVVALLLNWLLVSRVGVHGVAAFTVVNYATFASLMVYYGTADALHLLVSQNMGAGNPERAHAFFKCALGGAAGFGVLLAGSLLVFGEHWLRLFLGGSPHAVLAQAEIFLRVVWPLLLINGANVVFTVYLAAMQRPLPASLLALSRSLVLPGLLLFGFARLAPSTPFVLALPLAEGLTFLLGVAFLRSLQSRATPPVSGGDEQVAVS